MERHPAATPQAASDPLEQERRISEAKFKGIVAIASDAIISMDENSLITDFNSGAEQIFGYAAEEMIGQRIELLIPERFRASHARHVRAFAEGPSIARRMGERREIAGLRRNGEEFPAEASISKLVAEGSYVMTVLLRDITVRKRIEEDQRLLARAGSEFAASLDVETTLQTIARLPLEGQAVCCVLFFVEEFEPVLVHVTHRDAALEERLQQLAGSSHDADEDSPAMTAMRMQQPLLVPDLRAWLQDAAKPSRHVRALLEAGLTSGAAAPLISGGRVIGALSLFTDQSARPFGADELSLTDELARRSALAIDNARLYRSAQEALKARDDILTVVSHDLGNPLAAIRIGTSLLLRGLSAEERQRGGWQHLEAIQQSTAQMERLINDLLDTKRIEAGLLAMHIERVSATSIVRAALDLTAPAATSTNVSIQSHVADDVPALEADATRLQQALGNIVGNAIKFSRAHGTVVVRVRRAGDAAEFMVADEGIGIAKDAIDHVFDHFWHTRGAGRVGMGLGLAITKGIVEAHGGRVWVESEAGQGARFFFTVPLSAG